jgi:hypothetical protein
VRWHHRWWQIGGSGRAGGEVGGERGGLTEDVDQDALGVVCPAAGESRSRDRTSTPVSGDEAR